MPEGRPAIPAQLQREVKMEAGYRCAIPSCRQHPIEIAHIVPWAEVLVHEFLNLIALCGVCHARYDRGDIDRTAMRQFKANLGIINARYGEYERRLLEHFASRHRLNQKTFNIAEEAGGAAALAERLTTDRPEFRETVTWFFETGIPHFVGLPFGLEFLMSKLILDGHLVKVPLSDLVQPGTEVTPVQRLVEIYLLTESGLALVERLIAAEPVE
jgi:hypothetical protein